MPNPTATAARCPLCGDPTGPLDGDGDGHRECAQAAEAFALADRAHAAADRAAALAAELAADPAAALLAAQ